MKLHSIKYLNKFIGNGEVVKSASLSTGYNVFLIRMTNASLFDYIVAVRNNERTFEFNRFFRGSHASHEPFTLYLHFLCSYA